MYQLVVRTCVIFCHICHINHFLVLFLLPLFFKQFLADRSNGRAYGTMFCPSVCLPSVMHVLRLNGRLSDEANRGARPLPYDTNSDPHDPRSPQTVVLTPPQILALQTVTKPLQLAACYYCQPIGIKNLPTPYPTTPLPTPYGHLFPRVLTPKIFMASIWGHCGKIMLPVYCNLCK